MSPSDKIKPVSQLRAYKKGANIFFQGEAPRRGVMITDGFVRSYTITSSGEERTIAYFTKNDNMSPSWLMGSTSYSLFYYEAVSNVKTLQFTREDFTKHILNDHTALQSLFKTITEDQTAAMLRINGLEQSRAEDKVAFTLYYLVFRYGTQTDRPNVYYVDIALRHSSIASLVGLTRESTSRILGKLQKQGIIEYKQSTYKINKELLENFIGEDAFRDVEL